MENNTLAELKKEQQRLTTQLDKLNQDLTSLISERDNPKAIAQVTQLKVLITVQKAELQEVEQILRKPKNMDDAVHQRQLDIIKEIYKLNINELLVVKQAEKHSIQENITKYTNDIKYIQNRREIKRINRAINKASNKLQLVEKAIVIKSKSKPTWVKLISQCFFSGKKSKPISHSNQNHYSTK